MKRITNINKVTMLALLSIIFFNNSCSKGTNSPAPAPATTTTTTSTTTTDTGPIAINLIGLKVDSGYAYKLGYNLPQTGDSNTSPKVSTLRLFENGVELGPAHAYHTDIRNYGLGQFSHWGTELYFSTSDNSNPLINGRKYTYLMH